MELGPFFKRVYLEITNICNQSCPFCPRTSRAPKFLSRDDFDLILTKLQGHTKHLYFHVLGEPLLHPGLPRFLDEAHNQGYWVNLVTNGSLIAVVGPELMTKPALRQISFSLHSLAHLGTEVTRNRLAQILQFVDQATQETAMYCSLRLWTGGIEHNGVVIETLTQHYGLDFDLTAQLASNQGRGIALGERIFLNPAEEFAWPSLEAPLQVGRAFCHGLRQQLAILVDGTVVPCCLDGQGVIALGNIHQEDLGEIYTSPRVQEILQGFHDGVAVEELCQRCDYRTRFTTDEKNQPHPR